MKRNPILTVFWIIVMSLPASATIINIPDDYPTIQEGIDASTDGDTVLVQPGTYEENINFNGHNIVLGSLFLTTGDTAYISSTIIDGNQSGSVLSFHSGEDNAAIVCGFEITNGNSHKGGAVNCLNESSPTISRNYIIINRADIGAGICLDGSNAIIIDNIISGNFTNYLSTGGGIHCANSSILITKNLISDNTAGTGGGIYCFNCADSRITDNNIYHNRSYGNGGGIYCDQSDILIIGNIIERNNASTPGYQASGGGIYCRSSSALISGNDIRRNGAYGLYSGGGGGILLGSSNPSIINNIVTENIVGGSYGSSGGGIACYNSNPTANNNVIFNNRALGEQANGGGFYVNHSNPIIVNSILYENEADSNGSEIFVEDNSTLMITYSNIQGGWEGEGNIDADPLFRDPENGDFHLMSTACGDPYDSPCIDVGHPDIIDSLLDCSWGLGTILSDMGAYGGGDSATVGIVDHQPEVPDRFGLMQNYPNPFNAMTVIRYSLPAESDVTIEIYDILGRRIQTLFSGNRPAGSHSVIWDARDLPSGIYLYRIDAGQYSKTIRCLLLK